MLAELGPLGLALLAALVAVPFVAILRSRDGLAAGAFGAFCAYVAHAAVDWDWELSGVTAAALACGALVVVAARDGGRRPVAAPLRVVVAVASVALFGVAFVGWIGNTALSRAENARDDGRYSTALTDAARARSWMPWSADPRVVEGEALLLVGDRSGAAQALRSALRRDPGNWEAWFALSRAATGPEARRALARARDLNRVDPSVQQAAASAGGSPQ
jgi:hypothetical protein